MTLKELREHVSYLGFDSAVYDGAALRLAADRALGHLFLDHPSFGTARIPTPAPRITTLYKSFNHRGGATERLAFSGRALTMRLTGSGSYRIVGGHEEFKGSFAGRSVSVRQRLSGDGYIEFSGPFDFCAYGIAVYASPLSDGIDGIPEYRAAREYPLKGYLNDFASAETPPTDSDGRVIAGATVESDRLTVPFSYSGEAIFTYRRTPRSLADANDDTPVDCPEQLAHALPLLTASYIILDDDAEKASHYLALYKNSVAVAARSVRHISDATYFTNGWA